jgi:hypothetical protein
MVLAIHVSIRALSSGCEWVERNQQSTPKSISVEQPHPSNTISRMALVPLASHGNGNLTYVLLAVSIQHAVASVRMQAAKSWQVLGEALAGRVLPDQG